MIIIEDWGKSHRSALAAWPNEPNLMLPWFLLRSATEPYQYEPSSFAIMLDEVLIGRFTYRSMLNTAFIGIVLNPSYRGRRLSVPSLRACLLRLGMLGLSSAYCSVAVANIPSLSMLLGAGFSSQVVDWRVLPDGFNVSSLLGFSNHSYRLLPVPAMAYISMSVALDALSYTEVA